jgi:hypothetical protein
MQAHHSTMKICIDRKRMNFIHTRIAYGYLQVKTVFLFYFSYGYVLNI